MRFAAQLSEVPLEARNLLGIEGSAAYARSVSQRPDASQQMVPHVQETPQTKNVMQYEHLKRRAGEIGEVSAKRLKTDQPDLEGQFWTVQLNRK